MNGYVNSESNIHTRINKFVVSCFVNIVKKIPKHPENIRILQQISGSLTSIGANDQEADATDSTKDFIAKYKIVKKEAKETEYWLNFLKSTEIFEPNKIDQYIKECHEILLIISKIIINSSK